MCGPIRHHKCPKCSMLLPKPIEHLKSHICQNTSLDWTILTGQTESHEFVSSNSKTLAPNLESSKRKYKCEKCSKGYQHRASFVKHQKICIEKTILKTALQKLSLIDKNSFKDSYVCNNCTSVFEYPNVFKEHQISCLQSKEEIVNKNRLDFEDLKQDPLEIQPEFKTNENSFFVNDNSTNFFESNSLKEFDKSKNKPIESRDTEMFSEKSYESFDKPTFDEITNERSGKNCLKEPAKKPIVVSMNDLNQGASMNSNPLKTQLHECSKCEFKTKIKSELKTHKMSIHAPSYKRYHPDPDRKFNCTSCDFRYSTYIYIRTVSS